MYDSVAVMDGKIPPNTYSFRAKNFYGMRDVTEISPFRPEEVLPDNADDIVRQLPDISEINLKEWVGDFRLSTFKKPGATFDFEEFRLWN